MQLVVFYESLRKGFAMFKKFAPLALSMLFILSLIVSPLAAQEKTRVVWFIGLGTGGAPDQLAMQEQVVAAFNAANPDIELVLNIAENNVARDTLSTLIAAGNAPDIIGPVGSDGANAFGGNWLDLQPLVDSTGYDLTQWSEAAVNFYRTPEGLIGLPLATFPAMIYYRPAMFDEAGLNYPPTSYGEMYVMPDGTEVEWSVDTLRDLAMMLTVDANGFDATEAEFDPNNIVQWGFHFQWYGEGRQIPTMWGAEELWNPETGAAQLPENWRTGFRWWYDGMWTDHFAPNAAQESSDMLGAGNAFNSGNLAMAQSHLWYTCCLQGTEWNMAPVPSYNGQTNVRLHADTFRIFKGTQNPEAAFRVLTYLVGDASLDLLSVYGGMPARESDQAAFFARLDERYTQGVNWDVVGQGLNYADNPSHEAWMPNYLKARDRITAFSTLLANTPGLDLDAEFDRFVSDLQAIFDEVQ
jgi:multiple sugar transport system substrate-binding protein